MLSKELLLELAGTHFFDQTRALAGANAPTSQAVSTLLTEAASTLSSAAVAAARLDESFAEWLAASEARMERMKRENARNQDALSEWLSAGNG